MLTKRLITFIVLFLSINSHNLCMENDTRSSNIRNFSPSCLWNTTTIFISNHKKAFLAGAAVGALLTFIALRKIKSYRAREEFRTHCLSFLQAGIDGQESRKKKC